MYEQKAEDRRKVFSMLGKWGEKHGMVKIFRSSLMSRYKVFVLSRPEKFSVWWKRQVNRCVVVMASLHFLGISWESGKTPKNNALHTSKNFYTPRINHIECCHDFRLPQKMRKMLLGMIAL